MESSHTMWELQQKQSLPLNIKIRMTEERIRGWVREFGIDGVYVSFSGGKDSTVLLDIARKLYPDIKAMYVDTGLEYPEIRDFVKSYDNVDWLKPKLTFKEVVQKYGYPFISKEVSERVYGGKRYLEKLRERESRTIPYSPFMADLMGIDRRENKDNETYRNLQQGIFPSYDPSIRGFWRYIQITGQVNEVCSERLGEGFKSQFNYSKYKFCLNAPFEISNKCCSVMKKAPAHSYSKKTGRYPITGQMACESRVRTQQWLKNGCNGFNMKIPTSNPMSFWTEQDVLKYIVDFNLPICSVYGDVIEVDEDTFVKVKDEDIQYLFDINEPLRMTTKCQRTGCMFCGYGCHLEKPGEGRFELMKTTHPKQYEYIMKPEAEGGLGYKEKIDWLNENGNLNIKY